MLEAHLDESNTHEQSPLVLSAGYLFTPDGSRAFADLWKPFLESRGMAYFHANKCNDEEVFSALIHLVIGTAEIGFVRFATREMLKRQHPRLRQFTGSPYALCTLSCMEQMAEFAKERNETVLYFVEGGNEYQGEIDHFISQIKHDPELRDRFSMEQRSGTFDKKQVIHLQAADLLGWQFQRAYAGAISAEREKLIQNFKKIPHRLSCFNHISLSMQAVTNSVLRLMSNRKYVASGLTARGGCA
jgi:hypothetical protein